MKKIITISALITVILVLATSGILISLPVQPPKARTGAPGEGTCSDCHTGAGLNMGPGHVSLSFSGAGNEYKANKNYTVTVTVIDTTKVRYGFQTVSLDANNTMEGKITLLDTSNTKTQKDNATGRKYVNNYYGTGNNVWTYKWKAPASSAGAITFYGAGNATNGNDLKTGDNVYTTTMVITPWVDINKAEAFESTDASLLSVYPNPVSGADFTVSFSVDEDGMVAADLIDLNGRYVESLFRAAKEAGRHQEVVHLNRIINPGVYLVAVKSGEKVQYQKVMMGM
jgi:hypothetical protein